MVRLGSRWVGRTRHRQDGGVIVMGLLMIPNGRGLLVLVLRIVLLV